LVQGEQKERKMENENESHLKLGVERISYANGNEWMIHKKS
jgi:hypothetical protein